MSEGQVRRLRVMLKNRQGLHARPAHLFVQTANAYASSLRVGRADEAERVNGKLSVRVHPAFLYAGHP